MPSSDSEGFESADEGHGNPERQEIKNKLSSSNYSDKGLEKVKEPKEISKKHNALVKPVDNVEAEGWDDFDIDEESVVQSNVDYNVDTKVNVTKTVEKEIKSQDTGWDAFDDWGQDPGASSNPKEPSNPVLSPTEPEISSIADRLATVSTKPLIASEPPVAANPLVGSEPPVAAKPLIASAPPPATTTTSSWGWGWTVDSILNTATAGISTLTNQVSQGLSTVLESGIGAPDPAELARANANEGAIKDSVDIKANVVTTEAKTVETQWSTTDAPSSFSNLISGVTKFVESTGTKVISGSLDTLETIGKKTMEVLQDGDPGLAKKRAMLGLNPDEKIVLSQVLREAKARADEEDRVKEEKREAKEVHYENLFDDFEGLVHLEALEMLSRQINMRIEERLRGLAPEQRQEIKETLQQVTELCEMPEEEDEEESHQNLSRTDALHMRLQNATQDLGLKLQFQPLVKQYTGILDWLTTPSADRIDKTIYKRAVGSLAQATALSVELYHKAAEMLLVKTRRSTADEADALTQMTVVLKKHISEVATAFTEELNSLTTEDEEQINNYITNIYLEAGNSSTYIQNAFQLALPILQIGAV